MCMCPLTAYPWTPNWRWVPGGAGGGGGVLLGRYPLLLQYLPPPLLPLVPPLCLCLLFPVGFLALKHCIRAPPTGQRNFTDRYTRKYGALRAPMAATDSILLLFVKITCQFTASIIMRETELPAKIPGLSVLYVNWSSGRKKRVFKMRKIAKHCNSAN